MTGAIDNITTTALALALDAAKLRQQAIAANIANHSTDGYVPQTVEFERQMDFARRTLDAGRSLDAASLADVKPRLTPMLDRNGVPANKDIDQLAADLTGNAVQFQALAKGLSRHFSILALAVNDGKR